MICCENIVDVASLFHKCFVALVRKCSGLRRLCFTAQNIRQNMEWHKQNLQSQLGICMDLYCYRFLDIKKKKNHNAVQMDKFLVATMEMDTFVAKLQFLNYQILLMPVVKFPLYNVKSLRYSLSNCSKLISVNFNPFELFSPIRSHSVHFNLIQFTSVHFSQFGLIQSTFVQLLKNEKH